MKINPVILIIVIGLGVYIGLNVDGEKLEQLTKTQVSSVEEKSEVVVEEEPTLSKEEQQQAFSEFYVKISEFITKFEELDNNVAKLDEANVSKLKLYEIFQKLKTSMDEGQKLPVGNLVPEGFSKTHEEIFDTITTELSNTFQYRKFAYDHFLEYLEDDSLKDADTSKQWLQSAQSSLQTVVINLEVLKLEFGVKENQPEVASDQSTDKTIQYEIKYTHQHRYDGGISYYVLIDPVDLSNTSFVEEVKQLINNLVKEKGGKVSIQIFDDINVLELSYRLYGDLSLDRPLTEDEYALKSTHYIAAFSGQLETGLYYNSLDFFPSASSDTPKVGKYVQGMEYNPE